MKIRDLDVFILTRNILLCEEDFWEKKLIKLIFGNGGILETSSP
jgi:hypothetical protein